MRSLSPLMTSSSLKHCVELQMSMLKLLIITLIITVVPAGFATAQLAWSSIIVDSESKFQKRTKYENKILLYKFEVSF